MLTGDKYPFTKKNVDASPEKHGVYELYDGAEVIYIGRAWGDGVTIRSRLQAHQRGDEGPCTEKATHYRREELSAADAKKKEADLIKDYEESNGELPRCNEVRP